MKIIKQSYFDTTPTNTDGIYENENGDWCVVSKAQGCSWFIPSDYVSVIKKLIEGNNIDNKESESAWRKIAFKLAGFDVDKSWES